MTTVQEEFQIEYSKIIGQNSNLIYGNFADPKNQLKPYTELNDRAGLQLVMQAYLEDYNQITVKTMSLVLFESAVEHVARISRIINQPYGNALLVG